MQQEAAKLPQICVICARQYRDAPADSESITHPVGSGSLGRLVYKYLSIYNPNPNLTVDSYSNKSMLLQSRKMSFKIKCNLFLMALLKETVVDLEM